MSGENAEKDCDHITLPPPFLHTINIIIVVVAGYGSIHGGIVIVSSSCQRGAEIIGLIDPRLIRAFAGRQIMILENWRKFLIRLFLSLGRHLFVGGSDAGQIGRVAYCEGGAQPSQRPWSERENKAPGSYLVVVHAKTRTLLPRTKYQK